MAIKYERVLKNESTFLAECQVLAPTVTAVTVSQNVFTIETSDLGLTENEMLTLSTYSPYTIKLCFGEVGPI